jgi:hypothetical protein
MTGAPAHIRDWLISLQQVFPVNHLQQEDFNSGPAMKETGGQKVASSVVVV